MTQATYVIEVDWVGDALFAGPDDDVTADVWEFETRRGRDYASQLTGRATAGQLRATLRNLSGAYSSLNTSSPIYGSIVPGRLVRIRTTAPATTTLWTGYLERIMPSVSIGNVPTVSLEASGPLSRLTGKQISPAALANETTGTVVDAILDAAGWPVGARDIDAGQTTITRWYADRTEALTAIREVEETELGFLNEAANGDINYEDRHHRLKAPRTVSQATFSDAVAATNTYRSIEQQDPLREIYNEIVATVSPLLAVGAVSVLWTLDEQPTIDPGTSLVLGAEYPNPDVDPSNGAYVDAWTTPAPTTDVQVSGADIADIAISAVKFANTMEITLTNNGPTTATVTLLQGRGDPVKRKAPVRVAQEDAASQAAYGERTYLLPGPWLPATAIARDFTGYLISRYKDPLPTLRMGIHANRDSASMTQALTRDISDRVTITADGPQTQLGITAQDFFIESITHRVSNRGTKHEVFFDLSSADGDAGYWVLGLSALGFETRLAY